jgi:hypothetical protein
MAAMSKSLERIGDAALTKDRLVERLTIARFRFEFATESGVSDEEGDTTPIAGPIAGR